MLDEPKQVIYKLLSFLLGYPEGQDFWGSMADVEICVDDLPDSPAKSWLKKTLESWSICESADIRREYIQNFDFRESTCLYLTAHEYGDSRERGVALIALHQMFRMAGYEAQADELPDYLPWLFEFLAVKPPEMLVGELEGRLARVCHRILDNLSETSLYNPLICAALATLPQVNYEGETTAFPKRQKADLHQLPFPVDFQ